MLVRVFIAEDDLLSRTILYDLLEDHFPGLKVEGEAETVEESLKFLRLHDIDLLFLDIELADGKGTEILSSLEKVNFEVIVTTAYEKYINDISSFRIVGAIVKPLTKNSLAAAINKYFQLTKTELP